MHSNSPATGQVRQSVEFAATSVRDVRGRLARWLENLGASARTVEDARLVLSELVTNALQHAGPLPGGTLDVAWELLDGVLEMSIRDGGGPDVPHAVDPGPLADGGRGLAIVTALTDRWWVNADSDGHTVHASLRLS